MACRGYLTGMSMVGLPEAHLLANALSWRSAGTALGGSVKAQAASSRLARYPSLRRCPSLRLPGHWGGAATRWRARWTRRGLRVSREFASETWAERVVSDSGPWLAAHMAVKRGRGGRPGRGERDQLLARPPMPVGDAFRDRAEALGISISDYMSALIAREVGLGDMAPMPKGPKQQTAPLELEAATRRSA